MYALISSGWNKALEPKEGGAFSETAVWQEAVKGIDPEPPRRMRQTDWEQLRKIISCSRREQSKFLKLWSPWKFPLTQDGSKRPTYCTTHNLLEDTSKTFHCGETFH